MENDTACSICFLLTACLLLIRHWCSRQPRAFFHNYDLIGVYVVERFRLTARPTYIEDLDFTSLAEAEVHSEIALGVVAPTATHFVDLRTVVGDATDSCANAIPI